MLISMLPKYPYQAPAGQAAAEEEGAPTCGECTEGDEDKECMICLSEYETGEMITSLPCFHKFHSVRNPVVQFREV
jgi:hypothetical protein